MEIIQLKVYYGKSIWNDENMCIHQSSAIADKFTKQQKLDRVHIMLEKIKQRLEYEIECEFK